MTVAPGTPAGPYTVTYQVCEVLNPANCDTADVIITVNAGNIVADADSVSGINGLTGAADVLDVLPGDTLNGNPALLGGSGNVTMSVVTPAIPVKPGAPVPVLNLATGLVSVPRRHARWLLSDHLPDLRDAEPDELRHGRLRQLM